MTTTFSLTQLQRLQPAQLLHSLQLAGNSNSGSRPDGRTQHQHRVIQHHNASPISTANASSIVSLGNTSVLCAVSLEIAAPETAKPNQGFIVPNVDLGPMCCPKFRPGPPNDESQILASKLKDIIISSGLLTLHSLVIEPAKYVWVVYVDVVCLSHDGNLFDAVVTAAVSALNTAQLPRVTVDAELQRVALLSSPPATETVPLTTGLGLSAYTFAILDDQTILRDPSLVEEDLSPASLHLVLDPQHRIHHLSFLPALNSPPLPALLDSCLTIINAGGPPRVSPP
ncbi:hypothetical protein PCANC_19232 [Puccinia coronata f. sp. avenae]|uniref:Ribosomal RNA-processing protein 43 n=1 Tax=Puccinia coronata f. sp. avenae TaxID=200324 RepID=A0A2N5SWI6_9BASI|nr:hypothetical protein PCASD_17641 [Puccinia coronata f. sp. avenae]PLW34524.1 hypothetical protein PCANC_19232 [Puccinia coronata f. sp. avenae]PLW35529.1 hypothetical protein PCASD_14353 [Puccinia coronata f. sp. avenae]